VVFAQPSLQRIIYLIHIFTYSAEQTKEHYCSHFPHSKTRQLGYLNYQFKLLSLTRHERNQNSNWLAQRGLELAKISETAEPGAG